MIIISEGWWIFIISRSHIDFEYFTHTLNGLVVLTWIHTPPPSLKWLSHLTIENSGIWISLSLISSVKKVSHRHVNNVDKLHKSYNTLYFDFVLVKRRAILRRMKLYIWGGGVTVVIIVGVAEAMPDSWSEAIDFVHVCH